MLLIYILKPSERLEFVAELIFRELMGLDYRFTSDYREYSMFEGAKIAYCRSVPRDGLFLDAHPLLWETEISAQNITVGTFRNTRVFFRTTEPRSLLPFDIFAAVFFLVSRYEEYLPHSTDQHGRFPARESLAFRENFLDEPIVNQWVDLLRGKLLEYYPQLSFNTPVYRFIPTIDVDHVWCYRGRPFIRTLGGTARSIIRLNFKEMTERFQVLSGNRIDPYDTFQLIDEWHGWNQTMPLFFILFADYGGNDNNVSVSNPEFRKLIQRIDREQRVGIHPSLSSSGNQKVLQDELNGLSSVIGRNVAISRQHFLKVSFPFTYQSLIREGIKQDFSLGYPSHPGFRAGIASSFLFFDLTTNQKTTLRIHPVTFMDVTFRDHLRLNPGQALEMMKDFIQKVKRVNGELVTIWHNESLFGHQRWQGWDQVYPQMIRMAKGK